MEKIIAFQAGEIILQEGEIGQAMYFIRQGSVEVLKNSPQGEVLLTLQNEGEVIGLLTFYSGEKRLATARARTYVECLRVEKQDHKDLIQKLPKWFQVVMKEFTHRLIQSNNQLVSLHHENQTLRDNSMNRLWMAIQYVDTLVVLSEKESQKLDDGRSVIYLESNLEKIQKMLRYPMEELTEVKEILKDSGLMRVELEPDRKLEVVALDRIEKLAWFAEFAHGIRTGTKRKLLDIRLTYKQRRQFYALKEYVQKQGRDTHLLYSESLSALSNRFEEMMKLTLDPQTVQLAQQLKLIDVSRKQDQDIISFQASTMVRTILSLNVIRRLLKDPRIQDEEELDKEAA